MPVPIARVLQEFQNVTVTASEPVLKTVVVGPHVHVSEYPDDRANIEAEGKYIGESIEALMRGIPASPTVASVSVTDYPGNPVGAIPVDASVKVFAEGYAEVATATDVTGSYQQNTLTTSAGSFSAVAIGDRVIIESDAPQVLEDLGEDFIAAGIVPGTDLLKISSDLHNILEVQSEHRLLVKKAVTGSANKGLFSAADGSANVSYTIGDNSATYDNKIGAGSTGQRIKWRQVKVFKDANVDFSAAGVAAGHYLQIGADLHLIESVLGKNHLQISGGVPVAPANLGEFADDDASATIAYSIGTTAGSYRNIVDQTPSGTGQRLAVSAVARRVFAVTSTKILELTQYIPFSHDSGTPFNIRVEHYLDYIIPPTGADGWQIASTTVNATTKEITIPANPTVTYLSSSRKVTSAKAYIQYQSLRQDTTGEITYADPNTLDADLGVDRKENILRRAVGIAVGNAGAAKIYYLAVKTNDQTGHTTAQALCANDKKVYGIVPLTQTVSILQSWKTHAITLSTPTKGKRRIILCQPGLLPTEKTLSPSNGSASIGDGDIESASVIFSPSSNFASDGVIPGDTIRLSSPTTNEYIVKKVLSGNRLEIQTSPSAFTGPEQSASPVVFSVVRPLSKDGQVEELLSVPASFNEKRVVCCWPDEVEIGNDTTEPGFYLAASLGGFVASLPSHQMTTEIGISGVTVLHNSNLYFGDDAIESLVDAGWYVFVQDTKQSSPYAIQQHTSVGGSADPRFKYLSAVKNFDYISNRYQGIINQFPAQWNVIPGADTAIAEALKAETEKIQEENRPKIGSPITELIDLRVEYSTVSSDKMEAYLRVRIPTVLNELDLHLISV